MQVVADSGVVKVSRKSETDIKMRDLHVRIDGGAERNLKFGGETEFEVEVGTHSIAATNRLYTRTLEFVVTDDGGPVVFEVANTARGCAGAFMALGYGPYQCELRRVEP